MCNEEDSLAHLNCYVVGKCFIEFIYLSSVDIHLPIGKRFYGWYEVFVTHYKLIQGLHVYSLLCVQLCRLFCYKIVHLLNLMILVKTNQDFLRFT